MVNGWIPTSLGDILTQERRPVVLDSEKKYAEIGVYSYGRGIFHKQPRTGFEVGNKDLYEIKQGDFIFQITFAWEGAIALASEAENGMYGSVRFPTYRVNENICDPKFLLNYFRTEEGRREVGRISPGSAGRNRVLATKRLPEIFVPLPPLTEQHRIVAHIESLAARVNEAQRLREYADEETDALWKSFLSSVFVPDSNVQNTVEYACEAIIDNLHATPRYDGNEFLCVRSQDIGWGTLNYSTMLKTSKEEFQERIRRGEPQKGDIVFVREGDIGRCAVLDGSHRLSLGQRVMMLRPDTKKILSNYMMYQLMSKHVLDAQLLEGKKGTTSHHLNISHFRKVKINVPPLNEQRRIVAYLDGLQAKVSALRGLQSASGEELSALMPSILDKAFKGEL